MLPLGEAAVVPLPLKLRPIPGHFMTLLYWVKRKRKKKYVLCGNGIDLGCSNESASEGKNGAAAPQWDRDGVQTGSRDQHGLPHRAAIFLEPGIMNFDKFSLPA